MDYDQTGIPAVYDRSRDHGPAFLSLWMTVLGSYLQGIRVGRILDLGCGTGRFSEALALHFTAEVVGVDPSTRMLDRARAKRHGPRVSYRPGAAEAIPLPADSVDVVFMSMSYHHFTNPPLAAGECRRVLRDGGRLFIRNGTREQIPNYPYVPFFPSTGSIMEELLPDVPGLRRVFEAAGLRMVASEIVQQTIAPTWTAYVDKIAARGDSVIAKLGAEELEGGLAAMRRHVPEVQAVVEPIDLVVFR